MGTSLRRFAYLHPYAYRRLVSVLMTATLVGGIMSAVGPPAPRRDGLGLLERQLPLVDRLAASSPASSQTAGSAPTVPLYASLETSTDTVALGYQLNAERFGTEHWPALYQLWERESGWNPAARNPLSGACGIPQALPCRQLSDRSAEGQIRWGLDYIARRYGDPTRAWQFWQTHRWY